MNETDNLKAQLEGYKAACEHLRLEALEWKRREAFTAYEFSGERLHHLDLQIDIQRERLGLDPKPGQESLRAWRKES